MLFYRKKESINLTPKELENIKKSMLRIGFDKGYKEGYNVGKEKLPDIILKNQERIMQVLNKFSETVDVYTPLSPEILERYVGDGCYIKTSKIMIKCLPMGYVLESDLSVIDDLKQMLKESGVKVLE